jgi:hypothetical protein
VYGGGSRFAILAREGGGVSLCTVFA